MVSNVANTPIIDIICVKAGVMTSAQVPETVVNALAKEIFENLDTFKERYPITVTMT